MFNVSRISKNLIAVSLFTTILVVWMGSRYLSDARTLFSQATQLERSVIAESTLFKIQNSLDQERAATQQFLLSNRQEIKSIQPLRDLSLNTKDLFAQARTEITQSRSATGKTLVQRYSLEEISLLITKLEDKFKRIAITRYVIVGQTQRPVETRDENVRMQLFDLYVGIIKTVNRLRQLNNTYPAEDYIKVLDAHDSTNAIWSVNESIKQTNTLIKSFLMKLQNIGLDSIYIDNLSLRIMQQHEVIAQELDFLEDMAVSTKISEDAGKAVTALKQHYNDVYRPEVTLLLTSPVQTIDPTQKIATWHQTAEAANLKVEDLRASLLTNTVSTAISIKESARKNLIFNSFLAGLCMLMAYATFSIGKKIQHQANHDELTGLPNRRYFKAILETLFNQTNTGNNEKLAMMTLDLNGFKSINDTMGHWAGDILLIEVARRLKVASGSDMTIARMGGDEFAIAFITDNENQLYDVAHKLRSTFDNPFKVEDGHVVIDTSIGFSVYPDDAPTLEQLQITSDFAMFSAKHAGRKTIQPYNHHIAAKFENRIVIEKDLQIALESNQLELFYQPQVNCKTMQVESVEALIRWNHPNHGMIQPNNFIGIAEETGLMPTIGNWVLNEACRQTAEWKENSQKAIRVAVNVSVHQIVQSDFVQSVLDAIDRHNIPAEFLELEVTESVVKTDMDWIIKSLSALKAHGIKIALDDFGTGYSSLSQLQELPLDTLKIDRSFINKLDGDSDNMKSITATITSIAQIFNLDTVAEGIETEYQLIEANKLGIDIAQGYYYSKPVSREALIDTVNKIDAWAGGQQDAA